MVKVNTGINAAMTRTFKMVRTSTKFASKKCHSTIRTSESSPIKPRIANANL